MGGPPAPDLVVEEDRSTGQVAEGLQVVVGHSWTAVQDDKRGLRTTFTAENLIVSIEGLVAVTEGRSSGVEGGRPREVDQCSGDEGESPTELGKHDERTEEGAEPR